MTALEIVVTLIILIIVIPIFLKKQKQDSPDKTLTSEPAIPDQVKKQHEFASTDTPISNSEPSIEIQVNETSPELDAANPIEPSTEPQTIETATSASEIDNSILPQDSILRRHYLTHLCAMVETLAPPQPTDSVLCRHYQTTIAAKIGQCLHDEKAMEQLISEYENHKDSGTTETVANPQDNEAVVCLQEKTSNLPQDSILRRHYLTHLRTMIETLAPTRPTDSVLCRHYDAMIAAKIGQCLNDGKAMEQLISDYENN